MSDWEVGDLAVCVDARPDLIGDPVPFAEGALYRVSEVHTGEPLPTVLGPSGVGLNFVGVANWWCGYCPFRFRKIRPDAHEACEGRVRDFAQPHEAGGEA